MKTAASGAGGDLVIGFDCGGSRSRGIVATCDGDIVRRLSGPGCGLPQDDETRVSPEADELCAEVLRTDGFDAARIRAIGVNLGGRNASQVRRTWIQRFPRVRVSVWRESAGVIPLVLARLQDALVVVLAGTGSIAVGEYPRGRRRYVCGGWGMHIGDEGSGYWIGNQAIRAALRSCEGSGPSTSIARRILGPGVLLRVSGSLDRLVALRDKARAAVLGLNRQQVAAFAPLVAQCAAENDAVAVAILERAGVELSRLALTIIHRLEIPPASCAVLMAGGLARIGQVLFESFQGAIRAEVAPAETKKSRYGLEVAAAAHLLSAEVQAKGRTAVRRLLQNALGGEGEG